MEKFEISNDLLGNKNQQIEVARKDLLNKLCKAKTGAINEAYERYLGREIQQVDYGKMGIKKETGNLRDDLFYDNEKIGSVIVEQKELECKVRFIPKKEE